MRQEQLEDVVALLPAGDRPEDPHPGHHRGQTMQDPQRDGGFPRFTFRGGDVDRRRCGAHLDSIPEVNPYAGGLAEFAKPRQQIALEEFEEAALIVARRVEHEVVEPVADVVGHLLDRLVGVG